MAGKTPALAVQNYIDPIRRALSCVTEAVIQVDGGYSPVNNPHVLTLGDEPVTLRGKACLTLSIDQNYRIVRAKGDLGPWKVSTSVYVYELGNPDGLVVSYHWHPGGRSKIRFPHLHHPASPGVHFPTRRIALEEVIRLAIREYEVEPIRDDWQEALDSTQQPFEQYQTWA